MALMVGFLGHLGSSFLPVSIHSVTCFLSHLPKIVGKKYKTNIPPKPVPGIP